MTGHEAAQHAQPTPQQQGRVAVRSADASEFRTAVADAVEYRGDVTVHLNDGAQVDGYVFDCRPGTAAGELLIRILPRDGSPRRTLSTNDISRLEFTGRDTAAGKSWEGWVKRYAQKRLAGETASIESESLDG